MANEAKSVVVTGAASGMGRAAATRLAKAGWRVLAVDLNGEQLGWTGGVPGISSLVADVSSEADNARIAAEAERLYGGLDAAIFNAGIVGGGSIDDMTTELLRRVIDVNLIGPMLRHPRAPAAAAPARAGGDRRHRLDHGARRRFTRTGPMARPSTG